jgi:hypothetical protein
MKNILSKQLQLLNLIAQNTTDLHPCFMPMQPTKGDVVKYIKEHAFFMNQEVIELMQQIGTGNAVLKPWKQSHLSVCQEEAIIDDLVKSEAIDTLCFCLNICLAAGITPDNIDAEYEKVWHKNVERQNGGY